MLRALICLSMMHVWLLLFIGDVDMLITSSENASGKIRGPQNGDSTGDV